MSSTHLDSRQYHSGVGVGQPRGDSLTDALGLSVVLGGVVGQGVQDEDLTPPAENKSVNG